ncbi:protein FAM200B-like [Vanessa cardui]|uniref:protein FAM200B-like n=1 Tax=Vanessa cardui TaxID=171605 RepID=UPI001F14403A|nr:protein FAM200B-like [Vanessa cardui]
MDKFIEKNRKRNEGSGESSNVTGGKRKKYRKYDDEYLDFGFTCITKEDVELPQCVVCYKVLAAESMLPNKLKRHLELVHSDLQGKPREFFVRKLRELKHQSMSLVSRATVPAKALLASYMVAHRIAKCKKPHTIAEELILPAAVDMVSIMIGESAAKEIKNIPLSNNTISRRIHDMAEDINEQIVRKLSGLFAIQLDEATDSNDDAQLICYRESHEDAENFNNTDFIIKLAYLCDIFNKLNDLNKSLQGNNTHILQLADKITGFQKKLLFWKRKLEDQQYWVRNPFQSPTPSTLSTEEEEQLIELSCDSNLKLQYASDKLFEFWSSVPREYHAIRTAAIKIKEINVDSKTSSPILPTVSSHIKQRNAVATPKRKVNSNPNTQKRRHRN